MKVTIQFPGGERTFDVGWLEVVRLVASHAGFNDVDVEQFPEKVTIEARGDGEKSAKATGPSLSDACERFCLKVSKS